MQIPLGITEDRLVGAVDVAASHQRQRRLSARSAGRRHRGVLYVDELDLLDDGIINLMLAAVGGGTVWAKVNLGHPCRPC